MSDIDRPDEPGEDRPAGPPPLDWARPGEAPAAPPSPTPTPGSPPPAPTPRRRSPRRTFDFGGVLGGTFKVYGRMLVSVLALSLVILGPLAALQIVMLGDMFAAISNPEPGSIDAEELGGLMVWFMGLTFAQAVLQMVLAGAISYLVVRHQQGRPAGVGESLQRGFARLIPILGTVLLLGLIVAGMFLPAILFGAVLDSAVLLVLALVATLVPFILFILSTYAAVPVCAVEKLGPVRSLKRSRFLCIGHRGQIFGLVFVMGIINYMIGMVAQAPFAVSQDFTLTFYAQTILGVVATSPLSAILIALIYVELRAVKEGVDPEGILSVFD